MRYSSRFFLYAPFSVFVLFMAGTMLWWWLAARALDARLDAMNGHTIARGVELHFDSKSIAGFPFRLDTVLTNLRVTFPASHGKAFWQAEKFASHTLIYDTGQTIAEAAGQQTIQWRDAGGAPQQVSFTPASLHASAIFSAQSLSRFDLDIVGLNLPHFGAERAQFHFRRDPTNDALDIAISADDVRIHSAEPTALGNRILRLELDGRVSEAHLLAPVLGGDTLWLSHVSAWSAQGVGQIDKLVMNWGKLSLSGSGALALDAQHRLKGIVHVKVGSYRELLGPGGADQGFGQALLYALGAKPASGALWLTFAFKNGVALVDGVPATTIDPLY